MNKKELIELVAKKGNLSKADASNAVDAVFDSISEALISGEEFNLVGFGKFGVRVRPERNARNPSTGVKILVPETKAVYFKVGKSLKDAVADATAK